MTEVEISEALIKVAQTVGIAVEHIYTVYVEAQFVMAIICLVLLIVYLSVLSIVILITFNKTQEIHDDFERLCLRLALPIISSVVMLFTMLVIQSILVALFCPEYAAIEALLNKFT